MRQTTWERVAEVTVALLLVIQLVPVGGTNPSIEMQVPASTEVRAILRRACYDCHSNETRWPRYSRVAPVSWLIASDVYAARSALNFSTWERIGLAERRTIMGTISHDVGRGHMPPRLYVLAHPHTRLSERDQTVLREWALSVARASVSHATSQWFSSRWKATACASQFNSETFPSI